MIRILIAEDLSSKTIDKLNEIPEFEIIEKAGLTPEKFAAEIKSVDAMVVGGTLLSPDAVNKGAENLKIIIVTGGKPNHVEPALANRQNIEIRYTPLPAAAGANAQGLEREGFDVIAILKDFFNV